MTTATISAGLRERKKQQTRDALIAAAQQLFAQHGYDGTTTGQIAAAANVSQRTLFRYFANKDEVALAPLDEMQDGYLAAVRARPHTEPPMTALRAAARVLWQHFTDAGDGGPLSDRLQAFGRTMDLVQRTPDLLATNLRRTSELEDELTTLIAAREGLDPATDLRPRLAVVTFDAAMRVATLAWCTGTHPTDIRDIVPMLERCLAQLPQVVTDWATPE